MVRVVLSCPPHPAPRSLTLRPRSLSPRSGISLTEVLISMGLLTVGLLGVAALFPVGSFYMQKAEIDDRGSAIAQSEMNDMLARGWLNPSAWTVIVPPSNAGVTSTGASFPSDGLYSPVTHPVYPTNLGAVRARFARPFDLALGEALTQPAATTDPTLVGKQFGSAFVIDPMGVAAMSFPYGAPPPNPVGHIPAANFPASTYGTFYSYASSSGAWAPWLGTSTNGPWAWPIRRVTFQQAGPDFQAGTAWQMGPETARQLFSSNDDLTTDFPPRADRPASQNWDSTFLAGQKTPLARQSTGNYSWIVTVVPTTNAARNALARNPEGYSYDVSVVVFYKRVLPQDVQSLYLTLSGSLPAFTNAVAENERAVRASVISTGLNGGELLLTDWGDNPEKSAFDGLKVGQWMMVCGPHPNSNNSDPKFVLNWYQILAVDSEGSGITPAIDPTTQRVVTLRGPQWPWDPKMTASGNICATICRGAVAVHTKTVRMESPRSSVTSPVIPPTVPRRVYGPG